MAHGKVVCICGNIILECRCIDSTKHVETISHCVCAHPKQQLPTTDMFEPHQEPTVFDTMHAHYSLRKIDAPTRPARHIINDGLSDFETSDGLAFTIGVCVLEAETRKEEDTVFTVMHPNRVPLYTIRYASTGHIEVKPAVV